MSLSSSERLHLLERLARDLASQSEHDIWRADLGHLRALEARIQDTARRLEPNQPEVAILAARQRLGYYDLAEHLVRRAQFPAEVTAAAEPVRVRCRWQETRILDLARKLEPTNPRQAIELALPLADKLIESSRARRARQPVPTVEATRQIARQMKRLLTFRQPSPHQRVHRILGDLRRLNLLDIQHRSVSELRRELAFCGNVVELKAGLKRIPVARDLLEESVPTIYRDQESVIRGMRENTSRRGLQDTIERFAEDPVVFGKLRGVHVPGIGNSPQRSRALDLLWHTAGDAKTAFARRERLESDLVTAVCHQRLLNENRELSRAYPSREQLLTELGRHMKDLEIHEVRPLLWPGQARLVQDLRNAEHTFLEPLRKAGGRFGAFDAIGGRQSAQANKIAALFRAAPQHILKRLTSPQMHAVMVATAIVKRATKVVARAARV